MTYRTILRSASAGVVALLLSTTAQAQLFRAYLASTGSDANPCTLLAPCRLLPAALAAVANEGEIWMLDSANYNAASVDITKSVTILAIPGALGSVVAVGGNAINIATSGVEVTLRNLVIVPLLGGGGTNGIFMTSGNALTVDSCLVANLSAAAGIVVRTNASVRITDSTIRNNGSSGLEVLNGARATVTRSNLSGNGGSGVIVAGSGGAATSTADIAESTLAGNSYGLFAWASFSGERMRVSLMDSRATGNLNYGVVAQTDSGIATTISVSNNIISNNGTGIAALNAGSKVWVSGNTVSDNDYGLVNTSAVFESTGNNAVRNNRLGDTTGTITVVAPQ